MKRKNGMRYLNTLLIPMILITFASASPEDPNKFPSSMISNASISTDTVLEGIPASATALKITDNNLNLLQGYPDQAYVDNPPGTVAGKLLLWSYGSNLDVIFKQPYPPENPIYTQLNENRGSNLWGQCVSACRALSKSYAKTTDWSKGQQVITGGVARGTIIATFSGNVFNGHCAIFRDYVYEDGEISGFEVWDSNYFTPYGYGSGDRDDGVLAKHTFHRSTQQNPHYGIDDAANYFTVVGLDSFGYTFKDSNTVGGPEYKWIELSEDEDAEEVLIDSDDQFESNIPLGQNFFFNFYGTDYSHLAISNNGLLFSGAGSTQYVNQPIKQSPSVHGFIAPFWDDIVTWGSAGSIYYKTFDATSNEPRKFVVEWCNNQHYYSSTLGITFEAILYEGSNDIKFQYKSTSFGTVTGSTGSDLPPYDDGGSATVGIESPSGNDGLQYSYNEKVIKPGLAIRFKFPLSSGTNLILSKQAPMRTSPGGMVDYTIHYHNLGKEPATNVVLNDVLSNNVEYSSSTYGGHYEPSTKTVTWNIGSVGANGHGFETVSVKIPQSVATGTVVKNDANIRNDNIETSLADNKASTTTIVSSSNLPPNVDVKPNLGGTKATVYWNTPITFSYHHPTATAININIHMDDGEQDITGSMINGPPDWTFTTTFYPRHGHATVTYTNPGEDPVTFEIYIDPAGYVYDIDTNERVQGASVWLQWPDGAGDWENVPAGQVPPVMQPDENPLTTGVDGQYQWDVIEGSYRVHVEAPGYYPTDSIVVGIPPAVTDLHVGLQRLPNTPPEAPSIPAGQTLGTTGATYSYSTSATDPDGDMVEYTFDWADGTPTTPTTQVPSGTTASATHSWSAAGTYLVKAKATDSNGVTSDWSDALTVIINTPPITPAIPSGSKSGYAWVPYRYTTSAKDPDGDQVKHTFDWGDTTKSTTEYVDSEASATAPHTWTSAGTYQVKAMTTDIKDTASGWSGSLAVTIAANKPPNAPTRLTGPTSGIVGTSYPYVTVATDPNGDQVKYTYDWGDGTTFTTPLVKSGTTASITHRWSAAGTYLVRTMTTDSKGAPSGLSSVLTVKIANKLQGSDTKQTTNRAARPPRAERPTRPNRN